VRGGGGRERGWRGGGRGQARLKGGLCRRADVYDSESAQVRERARPVSGSAKRVCARRVSYLASLAKLLQHKAGMVTRMLSLLPSEVTADDTAAGNAR
jgi:hypothetical protein